MLNIILRLCLLIGLYIWVDYTKTEETEENRYEKEEKLNMVI